MFSPRIFSFARFYTRVGRLYVRPAMLIRKAVLVYSCAKVRQFLTLKVDRLKWGILWPIWKYMGHPALKQAVPIFCLFFAGAFAMAAGATSANSARTTSHTHHKRSSGISAY